jgi:hypothetical protein
VIDAITSTAVDLGAPGYDPVFGYGRIDAVAAVKKFPAEPYDTTTSFTANSATSGTSGGSATLEAAVVDEDGYAVAGEEVFFDLGGLVGSSLTNDSGIATITVGLGAAGDYEAAAAVSDSLRYDGSFVRIPFHIE